MGVWGEGVPLGVFLWPHGEGLGVLVVFMGRAF